MKTLIRPNYLSTEDSLTLYWEKPPAFSGRKVLYEIYLNEAPVLTTNRTHFALEGLSADTEYRLSVRAEGEFVSDILFLRTLPAKRRLDVTREPYGACGDGIRDDTPAIQTAIDDCGPLDVVYLPAGTYLSGALTLHSDMEIYLAEGALLKGSEDAAKYLPQTKSRFEGIERLCFKSLINIGEMAGASDPGTSNIIIRGHGTIEGGGRALMLSETLYEAERLIREKALGEADLESYIGQGAAFSLCQDPAGGEDIIPGRARGRLLSIINSSHIRISGLVLRDGPAWNIHMIYSRDVVTDHCKIISDGIENGDGWDPDSSEDCVLFASSLYTSDDGIAIKSGKNPEGNLIGRPARHIRVFDSVCTSPNHGFAIGSEVSGGIEDVFIWDTDLSRSAGGFEIKYTAKRGAYISGIKVWDSRLSGFRVHEVDYNDDGLSAGAPPEIKDIELRNCVIGDTGRRPGR